MEKLLSSVLKKITPKEKEKKAIGKVIDKAIRATEDVISPMGFSSTLAGSFLRDTWLPDKKEFDVFILFPESYSREKLEKMGLDIGKKIMKNLRGSYEIAYAEHPYVRGRIREYGIDIVPCYAVKSASAIKSAVDRTPFHNQWLSQHFSRKLVPEVRLFKQFLKASGLYGSDAKTLGFSGYLCELLVVHYGSFRKLINGIAGWEAGEVFIDLQMHHAGNECARERYRGEPLMVIDPVDPRRNVAAALSPGNFTNLVHLARKLLAKPSPRFFFKRRKKPSLSKTKSLIKKRQSNILAVNFPYPNVIQDVLWPQMRRTARRLSDILDDYEFRPLGSMVWSDERRQGLLLFELEVFILPDIRKLTGPSIFSKKHSEEFLKKYRRGRIWVENDNWVAEVQRKHRTPESLLKAMLSGSLKKLQERGIASYIARGIKRRHRILTGEEVLRIARKNPDFLESLEDYFLRSVS